MRPVVLVAKRKKKGEIFIWRFFCFIKVVNQTENQQGGYLRCCGVVVADGG